MSKKSTADNEPSNALLMRTLNNLSEKFDRLPTVEHLNKLENDLHAKIESNTASLRQELRNEFRTEMQEQATRMTNMISDVKSQVRAHQAEMPARSDVQNQRYRRARRSFKIWPLTDAQGKEEDAVRKFFVQQMHIPAKVAIDAKIEQIKAADQARGSKIVSEYVVTFFDVDTRDAIKSYASGLAAAKGAAGLRLDIPPCLKGSFKIRNEHGIAMIHIYGKEVKGNIRFDDRNQDLMMDIKLPTSSTWHNITIDQAREARRTRDAIDLKNIRQTALSATSQASGYDREKA